MQCNAVVSRHDLGPTRNTCVLSVFSSSGTTLAAAVRTRALNNINGLSLRKQGVAVGTRIINGFEVRVVVS